MYPCRFDLQDLEEKVEIVTEELRQERRRLKNVVLERDKSEKVTLKLKETTQRLEARLDEEARTAGGGELYDSDGV